MKSVDEMRNESLHESLHESFQTVECFQAMVIL